MPLTALAAHVELPHEQRLKLKALALSAVVGSTIFSGIVTALLVLQLQPFPGTTGDPVMRTLLFTAITGTLATGFKLLEVILFGEWIEAQFKQGRTVSFKDVFSRETARSGTLGGSFQAIYSVLIVALATTVSPGVLAAGRAMVVIPLVLLEGWLGIFAWHQRGRLTLSLLLTLGGATLVIVAGGIPKLGSATILLLILVVVGNSLLAWGECEERRGVSCRRTAVSIYTLTRFVYYTMTCWAAVAIWGVVHHGFSMVEPMLKMVFATNRIWLVLPACFIGGCADLFRLAAKPVISATHMYVIFGAIPLVTLLSELLLRKVDATAYAFVPTGWTFMALAFLGTAIIVIGAWRFPLPEGTPQRETT